MNTSLKMIAGLFVGLFVASLAQAEEPASIPKKVLKELDFMVGKWESEVTDNGVSGGTANGERKWAVGQHCITSTWILDGSGIKMKATGISGWNAKGKAVVEHWYDTNGGYFTVRYPIQKMKNDAWEGTLRFVDADGKEFKGTCRLEKGEDQWSWNAEWGDEGNKTVRKTINRKVKD